MSRKWSEKQSGALLGKWYTLKSMGYELLLINTETTDKQLTIEYKLEKEGHIESVEISVPPGIVIPSVAEVFPQGEHMQCEIAQLFPIQFGSGETEEFYKDGYSLIEWGPYHPLLPEPMKLKILMKDEVIYRTHIETGYNYRGTENLCAGMKAEDCLILLERISLLNGIPIGLAFINAVEKINGMEILEKAGWIRMLINEMSILQANLQGLNYTAQSLGLSADSAVIFRLICLYREAVAQISEHPLLFGMVKVGGLSRDIPRDRLYAVNAVLHEMEKELRDIKKRWESTPSISKRLKETGRLDEKDAVKLTGRPARAAGKPHDSRKYSNLPYEKLSYNIPVTEGSNCFARVILKLEDLLQSLDLIDQAIENLPKGDVKEQVMVNGSGTAMVREPEANGELIVFVKQEEGHVASLKIRNSSALHLPFLAGCLEGTELTDLPLVLSSFDLDLSGMEK